MPENVQAGLMLDFELQEIKDMRFDIESRFMDVAYDGGPISRLLADMRSASVKVEEDLRYVESENRSDR